MKKVSLLVVVALLLGLSGSFVQARSTAVLGLKPIPKKVIKEKSVSCTKTKEKSCIKISCADGFKYNSCDAQRAAGKVTLNKAPVETKETTNTLQKIYTFQNAYLFTGTLTSGDSKPKDPVKNPTIPDGITPYDDGEKWSCFDQDFEGCSLKSCQYNRFEKMSPYRPVHLKCDTGTEYWWLYVFGGQVYELRYLYTKPNGIGEGVKMCFVKLKASGYSYAGGYMNGGRGLADLPPEGDERPCS